MLSASEQRLWHLFSEIGAIDQLGRSIAEAALVPGLSLAQFGVLNHLVQQGGEWSPLRLASAFQVTKQTMTSTLARLERQGFIAIRQHPGDGRAKLVALTAEGAAVHRICLARLGPAMALTIDTIPESLVEQLLPRLALLRESIGISRTQSAQAMTA